MSAALKSSFKPNSGQTLLIIVLIMAVALTIGLALVSRSITDIKISTQEEQSARVFSVAEAGIEEAIRAGATGTFSFTMPGTTITAQVLVSGLGGSASLVFPGLISAGEAQSIWLIEHNSSGNPDPAAGIYNGSTVNLYWGGSPSVATTDPTVPALEATLIYKRSGTYMVSRGVFDPFSDATQATRYNNGFDRVTGADVGAFAIGGKTFQFRKTGFVVKPSPGDVPYILHLKLLYNNQPQALGLSGTGATPNLPSQATCYESTASLQGITRRVQQCKFYKSPPGILDYVLFSGSGISK